jgi:LPS-assembly protein
MGRLLAAALALLALLPGLAAAQEPAFAPDGVVMQADSLRYDQDTGIVTASGNVEMAHGGRILQADAVSYNEPADLVSASGNVVLLEPSGEVLFAEYAELTGDLREGAISGIRVLLEQNARFAANGARRIDGRITDMAKAIYSSCDLCEDDPTAAPLWQIKAARVVHDQALHDIIYYNAQFEVYGYPVFWTPYMRTPDPTVERRSGFLTPAYGSSSILGLTLQIPYYWNIAPNKDATITPFITGDEGLVMIGQYRERTETGIYNLNGSITRSDPLGPSGEETGSDKWRGFVKADGIWHPDETRQYGFDIYRASDDNYLSRYDFDNADTLTSQVFVEGFHDRSYASAFAYAFQGLRADDEPGDTPLVAPLMDYQLVSDPNEQGGFFAIEANAMSQSRSDGTDSRRFTMKGAFEQPWVSDTGHILIFRESLRGDAYQVNDVPISGQLPYSGFVGRLIPQASAEWRYPLVRQSGTIQQLVEPIVMTVISPNVGNEDRIPNEDSQEFEFDEVNLFNANRFPGYDRIEGGFRVNYGLRMGVFGFGGGRSELLVGQAWRARDDSTFGPETGLDGHFSDYVGRVLIAPTSYFDMTMRFRVDREDFTIRRNELAFGIGPESLRFDTSYVQLKDPPPDVVDTDGDRQQIAFGLAAKPLENWTVRADWRQDLTGEGTINYGATLVYEDECVQFTGQLERRFTDDGFNVPETIFLFSVKLKTLG